MVEVSLALLMFAVVAGDGAVRGLRFDGLAVRRHEDAGHEAKRTEALRDRVGLHVAVVVLAGPNVAARPLERRRDHVVDQAMLVGDAKRLEPALELGVVDLLEDVLEAAVIDLQNRVLGREIDGVLAQQPEVQRRAGEIADRIRRDCTSTAQCRRPGT